MVKNFISRKSVVFGRFRSGALIGEAEITLRDGDRLVVPVDLGTVRVFGQVGSPGLLPFESGLTAGDYVDRAGGPGPVATTVYTVDARTGRFTAGRQTLVQNGDAVFVDRAPTSDSPVIENLALQAENLRLQEERAEQEASRNRRQFLFQTITATISTLGLLIAIYDRAQ